MAEGLQQSARILWRLRRDLEVYPADEGDDSWTIKDPVRLTYYRVESEELEFLKLLDGQRSWQETVDLLAQRFPDTDFSSHNLQVFLASAINGGLLTSTGVGFGSHLAAAAQQSRSSAVNRKFFSLISHRFRGIDPTSLLRILDRWIGWSFHPKLLKLAFAFVIVAVILVLSRWTQLQAELPSISQLMMPRNMLLLAITIALIKILHEIGHGLTCYHFGGECHELGCIVVGFLPLLYCDVSDSWLQRNRTQRIYVAAAGIGVELFLAAGFGLLWLASIPGTLHTFFLNIMLLCSLNTVLVNGNPLLRYDGYYVLCDLMKIPNLGGESRLAAMSTFDRIVLGFTPPPSSATALRKLWLPMFGTASMAYRLVVLTAILMVIHTALKPLRLEAISYFLMFSVALGIALSMMAFVRQRVRAMSQTGVVSARAVIGLVLLIMGLGFLLLWPWPYSVEAPFTLTPGLSSPVYVSAPGYADVQVCAGDTVPAGATLAELSNPDLDLLIAKAEGELSVRESRVAQLLGMRSTSAVSSAALPAAEKAIENSRLRLATLMEKAHRLTLQSPTAGVIYAPRNRRFQVDSDLQQQFWSGTPLDPTNHSTWLAEQTVLCWTGTPDLLRGIVFVAQEDIEFVLPDAVVELSFTSSPGEPLHGTVANVNSTPETNAPQELVATAMLVTSGADGRLTRPVFAAQVRLSHESQQMHPPLYSTGMARIQCQPASLAARGWRLLSHTFAFEL